MANINTKEVPTGFTFLGDRVWVKLDKAVSHTTTKSGIVIPLSELTETDGGRITTRPSGRTHLSQGTVMGISKLASNNTDIKVGDRVFVAERVVNRDYQFFPSRDQLVQEFDGDILISYNYIETVLTPIEWLNQSDEELMRGPISTPTNEVPTLGEPTHIRMSTASFDPTSGTTTTTESTHLFPNTSTATAYSSMPDYLKTKTVDEHFTDKFLFLEEAKTLTLSTTQ